MQELGATKAITEFGILVVIASIFLFVFIMNDRSRRRYDDDLRKQQLENDKLEREERLQMEREEREQKRKERIEDRQLDRQRHEAEIAQSKKLTEEYYTLQNALVTQLNANTNVLENYESELHEYKKEIVTQFNDLSEQVDKLAKNAATREQAQTIQDMLREVEKQILNAYKKE